MTDHPAPCEVPPGLFFKAKDLGFPGKVDNGQSAHDVASSRRASQYGRCLSRIESLLKDLRMLKSFDEMGNVELAVEQVGDRMADTDAVVAELLDDIDQAAARYRRNRSESDTGQEQRVEQEAKLAGVEFDPADAWGGVEGRAERLRLAQTAPTPADAFGGGRRG